MDNNFKVARERCELSQKYVSVELGVSAPTVSEWESGKKTPTVDNLVKLKQLYGTTIDYLLGFTSDPSVYQVPAELSLRDVNDPDARDALLSKINEASISRETQIINAAMSKSRALSLSDRAMKIALAYDMADDTAKGICDLALNVYLASSSQVPKIG